MDSDYYRDGLGSKITYNKPYAMSSKLGSPEKSCKSCGMSIYADSQLCIHCNQPCVKEEEL